MSAPPTISAHSADLGRSFPPGVLNTVPSLGSVGGAALAAHKDVDKVAFTGSTITGRKIMAAAAESNLKKVSLELGGKSPHLVFESADLDQGALPSPLTAVPTGVVR